MAANIETVEFEAKHSDLVLIICVDENDQEHFFDGGVSIGIFGGDYTSLRINNETGQIIGWEPIVLHDKDGE